MWFKNRTLDEYITFSESTTQRLQLPRDRWIRSIMLYSLFTTTNSTGALAAGMHTIMTKIRVVASGNDQLKSVNGYRLWCMDTYYHGTPLTYDALTTSDSASTKRSYLILHFAVNPSNPFDYSALLPAHLLSSLDLYIDYGALATYFGPNASNTTGKCYVTLCEAYMDKTEQEQLYGQNLNKLLKMYESDQVYTFSSASTGYSGYIDIPVGSRFSKIGIFTETSGALSNACISQYKFEQMSPIQMELHHSEWYSSQMEDKIFQSLEYNSTASNSGVITGFTVYDPAFKSGFLDTRGQKLGDLKFKYNTAGSVSSGNIYLYMVQFI